MRPVENKINWLKSGSSDLFNLKSMELAAEPQSTLCDIMLHHVPLITRQHHLAGALAAAAQPVPFIQ